MSVSDEKLGNELASLEAKEIAIQKQVQELHRKLMVPVWVERREMVKQIPNFWSEVISNTPIFGGDAGDDTDAEVLEHLTDFHVEYDEARPNYRKVIATFKKNGIFKNEELTKEFILDEEDGQVISKSNIEYHAGKEPNEKKRKSTDDEDDEDDFSMEFLKWFGDDSIPVGAILTEQVFPDAFEIYKQDDDDDEDDDEIELGSDSEEEEEEETPKKKSKK